MTIDRYFISRDITERLEAAAQVVPGLLVPALLNEAKGEIERLREELKKEMRNTHLRDMRKRKK